MSGGTPVAGQAFGLTVTSQIGLDHLAPAGESPPARRVSLAAVDALEQPESALETVIDRRGPDGSTILAVERDARRGYRIEAAGYGAHRVSADGTEVESAVAGAPPPEWYRLLFAQVLPMAAALQGLELLHASAVVIEGRAVGFVASSGTGKSSLTAHLVDRGARFLTDDVLAVEARDDTAVAYPGAAYQRVQLHELRATTAPPDPEPDTDEDGKALVSPLVHPLPVPLHTLAFVRRGAEGDALAIESMDPPDPRLLLASTFVPHATEAYRLEAQLEATAAVSRHVRCVEVQIPAGMDAATTAGELAERLGPSGSLD